MPATARPRRSVLYMPGSNTRALEKAKTLAADVLILDLEDAVNPESKDQGRANIADAVKAGGYGGRELVIRINALDTDWGKADVAALSAVGAHAILLPKVETAEMILDLEAAMVAAGAPDDLGIWAMVETPLAMLNIKEIAASSPRLTGFVMGTSDLAKDLHAHHTRDRLPFITSLGLCLLASRAYGLAILDGVHLDLNDEEGFHHACTQGLELGFDGKTLIHPKQIATANTVFAPSEAEIAHSRTIIAAFEEAVKSGAGVVLVDGKLVENLHVENAKRLVALADQIKAMEEAA